jgi:uncharacterized protein YdhG (YjbR/CyaY superfamily)
MTSKDSIVPGGIDEYIATFPEEVQKKLKEMRTAIQHAAPGAIETTSYFQMPGYSYQGYPYNGMFAWFSISKEYIRLHVIPPVIRDHSDEVKGYKQTAAIVSFPLDQELPTSLIKELVKASIKVMKERK